MLAAHKLNCKKNPVGQQDNRCTTLANQLRRGNQLIVQELELHDGSFLRFPLLHAIATHAIKSCSCWAVSSKMCWHARTCAEPRLRAHKRCPRKSPRTRHKLRHKLRHKILEMRETLCTRACIRFAGMFAGMFAGTFADPFANPFADPFCVQCLRAVCVCV